MTHAEVTIQITPTPLPSLPPWMGEVAAFAQVLTHTGILKTIQDQVRFGRYDLIDFVVVLLGSILSGEPTLQTFYERLAPWASPFMALFGRNQLPHRSTLSRFLAALDQPTVEALRTLFQKDLLARPPFPSPVVSLIGREPSFWWSMWMEQGKLLGNGRCRRQKPCLFLIAGLIRSARRDIKGGSEEKWFARGPSFFRHIRISFSARLEGQATGITVGSCDERSE